MFGISTRRFLVLVAAVAACAAGPGGLAQWDEGETEPLDVGLEEEVEVHLVLVDLLVLDRRERTIPGLTIDDFVLLVGNREVDIRSLDRDCPAGAADDPLPGKASEALPAARTAQPRRFVLVFDYFHMTNVAETYDRVHEMLDKWPVGGEEHMIVSLGDVLRIEAPFTRDQDEVRRTLRRMRNDPDLYAGNYGRLHERRFFDRIEMLFDLLERWDGRKTIVLFSGPFVWDGFHRDPELKRLSALSTATRTAVYPVDTGGLRTPADPWPQPFGGPAMLRRLANETGGRMTSETNEIGLAYAKAHRDLGCTYTLGFYHPGPRLDHKRRLTVRVKDRRGLRVVYPEFYVVRSGEEKRKSLFRTAAMTPQMFESAEMDLDLFLLAPHSASRWRALLAAEVRPGPDAFVEEGEEWVLKGLVRKPNGTVVRSFRKKVPMPGTDPATRETPALALFHELRLRPGRYLVSAVLSDPEAASPIAATRPAVVAEIPRGEPFLVGPILGRRSQTAGDEPEGRRRRDEPEFEPLIVQEAEQGAPLDSLTVVCVVGSDDGADVREIGRFLTSRQGGGPGRFDPVSISLPDEGEVRCREWVDRVETARLEPGRYELTVVAGTTERSAGRGTAEFTIVAPSVE
jgi:VWFA-related protein